MVYNKYLPITVKGAKHGRIEGKGQMRIGNGGRRSRIRREERDRDRREKKVGGRERESKGDLGP